MSVRRNGKLVVCQRFFKEAIRYLWWIALASSGQVYAETWSDRDGILFRSECKLEIASSVHQFPGLTLAIKGPFETMRTLVFTGHTRERVTAVVLERTEVNGDETTGTFLIALDLLPSDFEDWGEWNGADSITLGRAPAFDRDSEEGCRTSLRMVAIMTPVGRRYLSPESAAELSKIDQNRESVQLSRQYVLDELGNIAEHYRKTSRRFRQERVRLLGQILVTGNVFRSGPGGSSSGVVARAYQREIGKILEVLSRDPKLAWQKLLGSSERLLGSSSQPLFFEAVFQAITDRIETRYRLISELIQLSAISTRRP